MPAIPIQLSWNPVSQSASPSDLNGLGTLICQQVAAAIQASVSFFQTGPSDPTTFVTAIFFNTTQGIFKYWNSGSAKYLPVTTSVTGDYKNSAIGGDDVTNGWIVCDGRLLTAIVGISALQLNNLQAVYGAAPTTKLPNITVPLTLAGIPPNGSFSNIVNPAVRPPSGTIGGLTFSSPPTQAEVGNLAGNCETLDESAISVQMALASSIHQSENIIHALNAGTGNVFTKVYCGAA